MSPSIRASYTKLSVRFFKQGKPESFDALCDRIGRETLDTIRQASSLALLPAEHHARVADGTLVVCGRAEARAVWRDVMLSSFDRALLRPIVGGALRLYGRNPASIMRMTPQAWALVFPDCGRSWMERTGPRQAVVRFEDLPPVIAQSPGIVESFLANCDAALAYSDCEGTVVPDTRELDAGRMLIDVSWSPKSND